MAERHTFPQHAKLPMTTTGTRPPAASCAENPGGEISVEDITERPLTVAQDAVLRDGAVPACWRPATPTTGKLSVSWVAVARPP